MDQATWKPAHAASASWTIKGVHDATREAVREAAGQADMLIGEWVDQALRSAAREALHPSSPPATKADLAELLEGFAPPHPSPPPATKADVAALLEQLAPLQPSAPPASKADVTVLLEELAALRATVQALTQAIVQRADRHERPSVRHVLVEQKKSRRLPVPRGILDRES